MECQINNDPHIFPPCATLVAMPTGSKALPSGVEEKRVLDAMEGRRLDLGLTQAELGEAVGISQGQVSKVLSGERPMTMTEAVKLCDALGIRLSDIVRDSGL